MRFQISDIAPGVTILTRNIISENLVYIDNKGYYNQLSTGY